jgi:hypothetical protein
MHKIKDTDIDCMTKETNSVQTQFSKLKENKYLI